MSFDGNCLPSLKSESGLKLYPLLAKLALPLLAVSETKGAMKNKAVLSLLAFAVLVGCSPMRYSQFTGGGMRWPTAGGSMAETAYAIPVYRDWPDRPYDVIGSVRFEDPRKYWDDGIFRMAAATGKKNGGDAIIVRFGSIVPGSWLDAWTSRPTGYGQEITALVIKWTPENVLQARRAEEQNFWASFRQKYPALVSNEQLVRMGIDYLGETGVRPNSPEMESKLSGLLSEIHAQPKTNLGGKWLFRGAIQNRGITSSESETFFGTATLVLITNRVTLISTAGKVELNFSGTLDAGQISGTLGFGGKASSLSVKCEGVALNEKISFAFQKLMDSGTVQGNLTFQR